MKYLNKLILIVAVYSFTSIAFAQKEKEIKVKVGKEKIYASLLTAGDKDAPVVIIIPGSGPTDRNGNSGIMQMKTYRLLAENFVQNGISSLRYDKLGIGKSTSKTEEKDMRFEDNVSQVLSLIEYLQKKKYSNIVLLGHSEGSLVGILAAQKSSAAKFISIAGAGRIIGELIVEQLEKQAPHIVSEAKEILEQLKNGQNVQGVSIDMAALFRESVQPYLISWLKYNPLTEIGKLKIPTLIVQGSTDIQVAETDAELLHKGKPDAEYVLIDGMNHILKQAPADLNENIKSYYDVNLPLHPEIMPVLIEFLKK